MKTSMGSIIPQISPQNLLEECYSSVDLPPAKERRKILVEQMGALDSQGLNCFNCSGLCCTNQHNSMQVDPVQTLELLAWLEQEGRLNEETLDDVEKAVSTFRLDKEFLIGKGRELRRHFTCPFYLGKNRGCSVSRFAKPYGCLGFNPLEANVSTPGKCESNVKALIKRENKFSEAEAGANELLKRKLNIYWDKKNLPFAIKDMVRALSKKEKQQEDLCSKV